MFYSASESEWQYNCEEFLRCPAIPEEGGEMWLDFPFPLITRRSVWHEWCLKCQFPLFKSQWKFRKSSLNLIMFLVTNNLTIKFPIMMQNSMLQNKLNFIYNYIWYTETQQKSASNLWLWEINSATFMYRVESSKLNLADKLTFPILIWQQKLLKQFPPQF